MVRTEAMNRSTKGRIQLIHRSDQLRFAAGVVCASLSNTDGIKSAAGKQANPINTRPLSEMRRAWEKARLFKIRHSCVFMWVSEKTSWGYCGWNSCMPRETKGLASLSMGLNVMDIKHTFRLLILRLDLYPRDDFWKDGNPVFHAHGHRWENQIIQLKIKRIKHFNNS